MTERSVFCPKEYFQHHLNFFPPMDEIARGAKQYSVRILTATKKLIGSIPISSSNMKTASMKIAEAFKKRFGDKVKTVKVKMLYTKEVQQFIKEANAAHEATKNSKLIFKG